MLFTLSWPFFFLWMRLGFGFHGKRYKGTKKQNYLILANHTCGFDPFFVSISFPGKPVYFLASDDLLRIPKASFWLKWAAAPIPKKKDVTDFNAFTTCAKVAKEGGNIAIFPEGNRSYSGKLGPIEEGIAKFAKLLSLPILLYRIENGYGVDPRWANKRRIGEVLGSVVREIPVSEVKAMNPH
ncbi:MAG: 1-acyl-sn-glycerol-3-phosphate acyltransferase, partial [Bacilli bacterium]|nr:1-acyl-sn-glycerol-3-phosphate acyltransferase [Bacilli bacterium]